MVELEAGPGVEELQETEVLRAQAELRRRFYGIGCLARAQEFARLVPTVSARTVGEALHRLCDEGVAEVDCLSDGTFAFYFPRR